MTNKLSVGDFETEGLVLHYTVFKSDANNQIKAMKIGQTC
jgi:hypothetical protein